MLHTRAPNGQVAETRVWIAEEDGFAWIEAASDKRLWYRHILADPRVQLERGGELLSFRAVPEPGPEGHARIRRLLRERYGWRDRWVGVLEDTSQSIAIRLEPL